MDPAAHSAGLHVYAFDRPGYGGSPADPGLDLPSLARRVLQMADELKLERFALLGVSGGAPCALATAHAGGGRIRQLLIVCGLGPVHEARARREMRALPRLALTLARRAPGLLNKLYARPLARLARKRPDMALNLLGRWLGGPDRRLLETDQAVRQVLADTLRQAFVRGTAGVLEDLERDLKPWDFDLAEIRCPLQLWHGYADRLVPPGHGRHIAARVPGAVLHLLENEGHFSLPIGCCEEILAALNGPPGS